MTVLMVIALAVVVGFAPADESDKIIRPHDIIILKNGSRFEGEIDAESLGTVTIALNDGGTTFVAQKSEIQEIQRRNPPERAYKARERDTDKTYDDQLALGLWCAEEAGLPQQAREHLIKANQLDRGKPRPYDALLELFARTEDDEKPLAVRDQEMGVYLRGLAAKVERVEIPFRAAMLLTASGETAGAIHMLEELLQLPYAKDDSDTLARAENLLAQLYESQGRREDATALVERVIAERDQESALDLLRLRAGWLLEEFASGKTEVSDDLVQTIGKMIELDDSLGEAYAMRGSYFMLQRDFVAATRDFKKAFEKGAVGFDTRISTVLNYAFTGKTRKAQTLLAASTPDEDTRFQHGAVRSYLLQNVGEAKIARATLAELVETGLAPWQLWILYMQTLTAQESAAELEQATTRFLELYSRNPVAFSECAIFRGDHALRAGQGVEARRWLDYVSAERQPDAELLLRVGLAHLLGGGDRARARESLAQAYDEKPDDIDIQNAYGYLEYLDGNFTEGEKWFGRVAGSFSKKQAEQAEPPPVLAYAMRGVEQCQAALGEEVWTDNFERDNGAVLNNWDEQETFGVQIELRDGIVVFEGTQDFKDDGLTILTRSISAPKQLSRFRARVRLRSGELRLGLRIEDERGEYGLVFFRMIDGVLAFSLNQGDDFEVFQPRDESEVSDSAGGDDDDDDDQPDDPAAQYDLRRVVWEDDGKEHLLEIRFQEETGTAELFFNGERVARKIRLPFGRRSRSGIRLGISGQASRGERYRFEMSEFEMFRRLPEGQERRRR